MKLTTYEGMKVTWRLTVKIKLIQVDKKSATLQVTTNAYGVDKTSLHRIGFGG